jgi:hypothetical protein
MVPGGISLPLTAVGGGRSMGALIRTKGTLRLACHFNQEFSTYINFYKGIANSFNTASPAWVDLLNLTNTVTDNHSPRPDHKCLLPLVDATFHPNLEPRWLWFLNTANTANGSLTQANHNNIANAIYQALTGNFQCIIFDAVETAGNQAVVATPLHLGASTYMQIVLETSAMPTAPVGGTGNPPRID